MRLRSLPCPLPLRSLPTTHEKIHQNSTGAPKQPVGPPLYTALALIEDEDLTTPDHFAFIVTQPALDLWHDAPTHTFEDEQSIMC